MKKFASGSLQCRPDRIGSSSRTGAAHALIAIMLLAFATTVAFSIDFAYMQLVRSELRAATDAAAKAGAEALMRTRNPSAGLQAAVDYAANNKVAGRSLRIRPSDVTLGQASTDNDGLWRFTENVLPYNAVRVNSQVGGTGLASAVPLFFGKLLGKDGFATSAKATAAQQSVEICLCIDRSASMSFNMEGVDYRFAPGNELLFTGPYYPNARVRNINSPPHPRESRWAILQIAIKDFLDEIGKLLHPPRTSLVTWSSDAIHSIHPYTLPNNPFNVNPSTLKQPLVFTTVSTDVPLPLINGFNWQNNATQITSSLARRGLDPMVGATRLSDGLDRAVQILTGTGSQVQSNKVVILMTDGMWGDCRDPMLAAQDAAAAGVTVHCVSMLAGTQEILTKIANLTGGRYYPTSDANGLRNAFRELAQTVPIVLTE